MKARPVIHWTPTGHAERWLPTTLDQLGKLEEFLEDVLADSPDLMGLESLRTGIRGPFKCFRQSAMQTPSGRSIFPDIVMFSASGHVIVVEVKRSVNPELRDRAVIAQIIDYASSIAAMTEPQIVDLFGSSGDRTWTECVQSMFGDLVEEELAAVLLDRMQAGELNLIIACDKIPTGLTDVVSGIASQSAVAFDLDVIEVAPFVKAEGDPSEILFVPSLRLSTEIVSRTAVTVTYREGDSQPSTSVQTTSLDELEESLKASRRQESGARDWTPEEVEAEVNAKGAPVTRKLFEFVKQQSADGQVSARGKKKNAVFGFSVDGLRDGSRIRMQLFNCGPESQEVWVYLNYADTIISDDAAALFREKLSSNFGNVVNLENKQVSVPLDVLENKFEEFKAIMLWFKSEANSRLPAPSQQNQQS